MRRSVLSLTAVLVFVSYLPAKTLTAHELRSDLLSAISLASETELFIGQIQSDRLLAQFQTGHADYLRDEASQQAKELRESTIEGGDSGLPIRYAEQLEALAQVLGAVRERNDGETLAEARERVEAIRKVFVAWGAGR